MSSKIPRSCSRQNQRDCTPSFIIAMKGESPDEQQTTNMSSAHRAHSNQGLKIESNREYVSGEHTKFVLFTTQFELHEAGE